MNTEKTEISVSNPKIDYWDIWKEKNNISMLDTKNQDLLQLLEPCTDRKFGPLMKLATINSSITLDQCQENSSGRKKRCCVIMIFHCNSYQLIGRLGSSAVSLTLPNRLQTNKAYLWRVWLC